MSKAKTIVRPMHDYVLLRRAEAAEKIGSIHVPQQAREKPQQALVVAVGPGRLLENGRRVEPSVKPGDTVWLGKWAGNEVALDGVEHVFVRESDLLAVE